MGQLGIIVVYVVALGALMYFFAIKPQKKPVSLYTSPSPRD